MLAGLQACRQGCETVCFCTYASIMTKEALSVSGQGLYIRVNPKAPSPKTVNFLSLRKKKAKP